MSKLQQRRAAQRQKAQQADGMVTTREAHIRTGVPVRTIQRWATKEHRVNWRRRGTKILLVSLEDVKRVANTLKPGKKAGG